MLETVRRYQGSQVFDHSLVLLDLFHVVLDLLLFVDFDVAGRE